MAKDKEQNREQQKASAAAERHRQMGAHSSMEAPASQRPKCPASRADSVRKAREESEHS
ncbi:hypothetical protein AB0H82_22345 [Streptomyces sp. NPDC050732]|uniref:hypothetical protein n=1 Tax=Streptomyces sp. NPDC050732 TaxID=3154632 RepID=UPI0034242DBD